MATKTDLALNIAELCDRLNVVTPERGDKFLADTFGVPSWSPEFFEILHAIVSQTVSFEALLASVGVEGPVLEGAHRHLEEIRQAFNLGSLNNQWSQRGRNHIAPEHSSPIRMLSAAIPAHMKFARLSEEERTELLGLVSQLLEWLKRLQLNERDFIRQNLIDGLERFQFRMERLEWFGWGYSVESLREVILAYLTLERGLTTAENPDAAAVLKRMSVFFRRFYRIATFGKDATETTNWAIGCYQFALGAIASPSVQHIAGYLTAQ